MSWQDRQYNQVNYNDGHRGGGGMRFNFGPRLGRHSFVTWLLIINIAIFFLDGIFMRMFGASIIHVGDRVLHVGPLQYWGHFSGETAVSHFQIWRFITFQFLHKDFMHLFGNMLGIFFLGQMIEQYFGSRRFLAFYLLCGCTGALTYIVLWQSGLIVSLPTTSLVGASAGVFGILIAATMIAPNIKVLLFFVFPIPLRVIIWAAILYATYTVLALGHVGSSNAGGEAAHLGGLALGFLLVKKPHLLNFADRTFGGSPGNMKAKLVKANKTRQKRLQESEQKEIDRILEKVNEKGVHSLSEREKKTLKQATERMNRTG